MAVAVALVAVAALLAGCDRGAEPDTRSIDGTVVLDPAVRDRVAGGKLFVHLKPLGKTGGPPAAVVSIDQPAYPQRFTLTAADVMVPGMPKADLGQRYVVHARHSPSGVPMREEGFVGEQAGPDGRGVTAGDDVSVVIDREVRAE